MSNDNSHTKLIAVREACLANAEALLDTAERELNNNVYHICFHLALLAFEEIGKTVLATINHVTSSAKDNEGDLVGAMDDHVKKIFWALWGGGFLRNEKFSKTEIESSKHLAVMLHEDRLSTLYTDEKNPVPIKDRMSQEGAERIIELTRARLKLEQANEIVELDASDIQNLTWYFNSMEDIEMRKQMFSRPSLDKFAELGNGKEWIKWLKETFDKHNEEMRMLAEKEINRKRPAEEDRFKPKYKLRIRIQTPSHSIRNNAFTKWNEGVNDIKIYKSDRKDAKRLTKGEIYIDFSLPKGLHPGDVYHHGLFISKTTVISLNIATLGVFWWNVQKDIDKYYEEILDLETDPTGKTGLTIAPHKRLHVDFDSAKFILDEKSMTNVYHVFAFLFHESKRLETFLNGYAMALAIFSKTDIHLSLEVNSFDEFYKALQEAMKTLGDWDGVIDFKEAVKIQFKKIGDMTDLEKTLDLGLKLHLDTERKKHHPITLTEVVAIKIYCDYYIQLKAKEYFEKIDKLEGSKGSS